jgi:hypothetical protein
MTDRDVVERFVAIVGVGKVNPPRQIRPTDKPFHEWAVQNAPDVRAVIALLLPYLGQRRRAMALEVDAAAATIGPHKGQRTHCPKGHPYSGDNLVTEPIKRGDAEYVARRCKMCRNEQARNRKRVELGITPDRFRK